MALKISVKQNVKSRPTYCLATLHSAATTTKYYFQLLIITLIFIVGQELSREPLGIIGAAFLQA